VKNYRELWLVVDQRKAWVKERNRVNRALSVKKTKEIGSTGRLARLNASSSNDGISSSEKIEGRATEKIEGRATLNDMMSSKNLGSFRIFSKQSMIVSLSVSMVHSMSTIMLSISLALFTGL
jgi:hypothetical protein